MRNPDLTAGSGAEPLGLGPVTVDGTIIEVSDGRVLRPSEMISIGDGKDELLTGVGPWMEFVGDAHNRGANTVFCDGRLEGAK